MSALVIVVLFSILGGGLLIAGAYTLAGLGAALLVSGALLFGAALLVRSGMTPNG